MCTNSSALVSIVLPVYNGARFLAESIESCLAQTYENWELIIVNDCSTDASLDIAQNFASKDTRIHVYSNEINKKLPASLNEGFRHARGKYYTWTSHDNRFHPDFLRVYVDYLEHNPSIGFLAGSYQAIDTDGNMLYKVSLRDPEKFIPLVNTVAYAFMYRAEAARMAGEYDENLFLVEDYEYWVRLWMCTKVAHIEECLYFTRVHPGTLTEIRKKDIARKLLEMRLMYFDKFTERLKKTPRLLRDFFISIADNTSGRQFIMLYLKMFAISPIRFGLYYISVYRPLKFLKKFDWYWALKRKVLNK